MPINNTEYSTIYGIQNMSTEPTVAPKVNPLTKFFRTPAIYISLPSGGRYWPEDAISMPENSELPVYPMTNKDEITLRTPDALINGQGVVDVIQSCIPAIKNAWAMPSTDVDVSLMAVRIASYGHNMDFEQICPTCQHEDTYGMDLRHAMSSIVCPDYDHAHDFDQVRIKFRPQNYAQANKINQVSFELQKIQQNINALPEDADRTEGNTLLLNKITALNVDTMTAVTEYIELIDTGEKIDDGDFINEFYKNIDSKLFTKIQQALGETTEVANIKPTKVGCTNCGQQLELNILFDYSSFFGLGS
jgi:hypothetical protein